MDVSSECPRMMRIGIYGGSFDPVHHGHLLVAQAALDELGLSKVVFVPAARSPFKPESSPAPDKMRIEMLQLALAGRMDMDVSSWEIDRGGISYTVDTIRYFQAVYETLEIFTLIGADQCAGLARWKSASELRLMTQFAVIPRPGLPDARLPDGFKGTFLRGYLVNISSTTIRRRLANHLPIQWMVPPEIDDFIRRNSLYL